ncbi:MAG: TetR/AcrR family transcriptional regulator [Panacagrimonas sp.]
MGRPASPLISRDRAARAALGVIDVHGLDALSLELVAQRMGVKAPSLYYHFKDKAELLSEIARLILVDVQAPDPKGADWKQALISLSLATRRSILQHPNAAPLLLHFFPRHLLLAAYDHWIAPCSLPTDQHMVLIEGLEKITMGSALFEASCRSRSIEPMPQFDRARLPHLANAIRANSLGEEALFVATISAFLDGLTGSPPVVVTRKARPANSGRG